MHIEDVEQVFTVLICMGVIVSKAGVHWADAFDGFIPSSALVSPGGLYTCALSSCSPFTALIGSLSAIGILGATVMPHSLFLGSALATQEREPEEESNEKKRSWDSDSTLASTLMEKTRSLVANARAGLSKDSLVRSAKRAFHMGRVREIEGEERPPRNHAEHENHSAGFIERHLTHGVVDMVVSLLGLALVVNALYVSCCCRDTCPRLTKVCAELSFLPVPSSSSALLDPVMGPPHSLMHTTYWRAGSAEVRDAQRPY